MKTLLLLITIVAISLLIFTSGAYPQQCDHTTDSKERFDAVRLLPPSKIFWDGKTVTARYQDKQNIYVTELTTDETSVIKLGKDYKSKWWWLLYSTCDSHLYSATEVLPTQFK